MASAMFMPDMARISLSSAIKLTMLPVVASFLPELPIRSDFLRADARHEKLATHVESSLVHQSSKTAPNLNRTAK